MERYVPEVYERLAELYKAQAEGKEIVLRGSADSETPVTVLHPNHVDLYHIKQPGPPKRVVADMQVWINPAGCRLDFLKKEGPRVSKLEGWKRLPYLDYEAVVVDPVDVVG